MPPFELQGHRGARGLKPENTLPGFETALDLGVTSIETDVHLTRDGAPVLFHDDCVSERLCRLLPGSNALDPASRPLLSSLTIWQLSGYLADVNPDPRRFPDQEASVTPLATVFARAHLLHPYSLLTLADLCKFLDAYTDSLGEKAGKSEEQRRRVRHGLHLDLELKRVPFHPEKVGDAFDGETAGRLEQAVVEVVRQAGMIDRTAVRSFDHRSVRAVRKLEPRIKAGILIAGTAPVSPAELARNADAQCYCPEFEFLDETQVKQCHAAGIRVVPWTVNDPADWERLLDWGVDGITTDFPDRLAALLRQRGIAF